MSAYRDYDPDLDPRFHDWEDAQAPDAVEAQIEKVWADGESLAGAVAYVAGINIPESACDLLCEARKHQVSRGRRGGLSDEQKDELIGALIDVFDQIAEIDAECTVEGTTPLRVAMRKARAA